MNEITVTRYTSTISTYEYTDEQMADAAKTIDARLQRLMANRIAAAMGFYPHVWIEGQSIFYQDGLDTRLVYDIATQTQIPLE